MTGTEVQALRIRMRDLNRELQTAAERRNSVADRLREADPAAKVGYEARLKVLDSRIIGIETELDVATRQLSAAPPSALVAGSQQDPDPSVIIDRVASDIVPIVAIVSVFIFAPFTIAISRFLWKRSSKPPRALNEPATLQRLEQLQAAVDTIAVEVERISEGQRFVTRVMNERALRAGAAESARLP